MRRNHDNVDVELQQLAGLETDKALAFTDGTKDKKTGKPVVIWLPRSQIEVSSPDRAGNVTVELPEWLAVEKDLI